MHKGNGSAVVSLGTNPPRVQFQAVDDDGDQERSRILGMEGKRTLQNLYIALATVRMKNCEPTHKIVRQMGRGGGAARARVSADKVRMESTLVMGHSVELRGSEQLKMLQRKLKPLMYPKKQKAA